MASCNRQTVSSLLRNGESVLAIFCSDIHLSLTVPLWRSNEPDWLAAQQRPLDELKELQKQFNWCPIFCAGDVFNKWYGALGTQAAELLNWAFDHIPDKFYAIPGQHDLPDHNEKEIHRSAFMNMAKAGKIIKIKSNIRECFPNSVFIINGFPFGRKVKPYGPNFHLNNFKIAIAHEYNWISGHNFTDAPFKREVNTDYKRPEYEGYDIVVYGDNHNGFQTKVGKTTIFNCGCLIRRRLDEADYKPQVGLLLSTGEVVPYYLDISLDKHLEIHDNIVEAKGIDMSQFFEELEQLGETNLEFEEMMKQYFAKHETDSKTKDIITEAMEKKK
jgi:DNA repair exonuclease SbcCD nuclease subunit